VGIGKVWDAINDPLFGLVSDRIRTRWGRRRVFLLFGAVPLGLSFMLMWLVPPFGPLGLTVYYALTFILFDTTFTLIHVAYNALTPELTPDYDERSSLNGYRMVYSIAGTLGAIIFATVLGWTIADPQTLFAVVGVTLGLVAILPPLLVYKVTWERPVEDQPPPLPWRRALAATLSNRPFWMVMGLYLLSWTTASVLAAGLVYFANYHLSSRFLRKPLQHRVGRRSHQPLDRPRPQGLIQVGDQVLGLLQAHAHAHDPLSHPLPDACLLRVGQVGDGVHVQVGRVVEQQAAGVAQRGGVGEQADLLRQRDGRAQPPLQMEGEHAAEPGHLPAGQAVVGVAL
jgi:hypothetical protein